MPQQVKYVGSNQVPLHVLKRYYFFFFSLKMNDFKLNRVLLFWFVFNSFIFLFIGGLLPHNPKILGRFMQALIVRHTVLLRMGTRRFYLFFFQKNLIQHIRKITNVHNSSKDATPPALVILGSASGCGVVVWIGVCRGLFSQIKTQGLYMNNNWQFGGADSGEIILFSK